MEASQCPFLASSGSCPSLCHNTSLPICMTAICPWGWQAKTNMIIMLFSECWQHPWCWTSRQPKPLCQIWFPGDCAETAKRERKLYTFGWEIHLHQHLFPSHQQYRKPLRKIAFLIMSMVIVYLFLCSLIPPKYAQESNFQISSLMGEINHLSKWNLLCYVTWPLLLKTLISHSTVHCPPFLVEA